MPEHDIERLVKPFPKQREFLDLALGLKATRPRIYLLYGGAKGGGKSFIIRWFLALFLVQVFQKGFSNVRVMLATRDYPSLWDMHISKVRHQLPGWLGHYHEQSHEFRLYPKYGGGVICFRNLDEVNKYAGREYAAIAVDELCQHDELTFHDLRSCLRWPGMTFNPFVAGSNPLGTGLVWVRKYWIERDFSDAPKEMEADGFHFIQAFATDNPNWDKSYHDMLKSLPEKLRKPYQDGDWYCFEGQFFSEWSEKQHVIAPFEIPPSWPTWRCVDYGYTAPFASYRISMDPDGRRYVHGELYARGLTATDQAYRIRDADADMPIRYTIGDPSMFYAGQGRAPSDDYADAGVVLLPAINVRDWNNIRTGLQLREDGKPGLQVFSTCKNLIRTLPALIHDKNRPEDLDTDQEDHAADALRYGLSLASVGNRRKREAPKLLYSMQSPAAVM